jgi:hypothetical protein
MGKNPAVCVIATIVAVIAITNGCDPAKKQHKRTLTFWYDTGTKQLYSGYNDEVPPMLAPSGAKGVLAAVFTKGSCDKASDRYIGYLEKYADPENTADHPQIQVLIRRENDTEWVEVDSKAGTEILAGFPPDGPPTRCFEARGEWWLEDNH